MYLVLVIDPHPPNQQASAAPAASVLAALFSTPPHLEGIDGLAQPKPSPLGPTVHRVAIHSLSSPFPPPSAANCFTGRVNHGSHSHCLVLSLVPSVVPCARQFPWTTRNSRRFCLLLYGILCKSCYPQISPLPATTPRPDRPLSPHLPLQPSLALAFSRPTSSVSDSLSARNRTISSSFALS
jgi:hypothetical protein